MAEAGALQRGGLDKQCQLSPTPELPRFESWLAAANAKAAPAVHTQRLALVTYDPIRLA